jgi:hypothetical protein
LCKAERAPLECVDLYRNAIQVPEWDRRNHRKQEEGGGMEGRY